MKYTQSAKRDRNERLYRYFKSRPDMTLEAIGAVFHISKMRVSQIIKRQKELENV